MRAKFRFGVNDRSVGRTPIRPNYQRTVQFGSYSTVVSEVNDRCFFFIYRFCVWLSVYLCFGSFVVRALVPSCLVAVASMCNNHRLVALPKQRRGTAERPRPVQSFSTLVVPQLKSKSTHDILGAYTSGIAARTTLLCTTDDVGLKQ